MTARYVLLFALAAVLCSCAGGQALVVEPEPGFDSLPNATSYLVELPQGSHLVSSLDYVPGSTTSFTSATGTALAPGHMLDIEPLAESPAWAVYTFGLPDDHYPTGFSVNIYSLSGDFWLGLANYAKGSWDWLGPYSNTGAVNIQPWEVGADYVSPGRNYVWAIVVEQGSSARVGFGEVATELFAFIDSPGIGELVVRLTAPETPRYWNGAPVVVQVNQWVMEPAGFNVPLRVQDLGIVQLSYLWPGTVNTQAGLASDGVFDYGGENCQAALRDVLKFTSGMLTDTQGRSIDEVLPIDVCMDNVGLNTFSHPGIVATNTLAAHGADLPAGLFLIGGENPVNDQLFTKELGYWAAHGVPAVNASYEYPAGYSTTGFALDYSTVGWVENPGHIPGRPVFVHPSEPDYIMADVTPEMWGKRYFSLAICDALLDLGVFTEQTWPVDVATFDEAAAAWPMRTVLGRNPQNNQTWNRYEDVPSSLNVMLVFAVEEHMQPQPDKPGIHMAYDGFYHTAGCWTRLNPDSCYVSEVFPTYSGSSPDNSANHEPINWLNANTWGHPNGLDAKEQVALAAVAEMADRTQYNAWADDLSVVFP